MSEIVIVIPYFQQEIGILTRALSSVFKQEITSSFMICVVDDGSPQPASQEILALSDEQRHVVKLIEQSNKGPAFARNVGIHYANSINAKFVALLDSDDIWEPQHLVSALHCLNNGADFFFCDALNRHNKSTVFSNKNFPQHGMFEPIGAKKDCYLLKDDLVSIMLAQQCPIATCTVVYNLNKIHHTFDCQYKYAGEDHLFFFQVALLTKKVAFSTKINVLLGTGQNLYYGIEWNEIKKMFQVSDNWRYWRKLTRILPLRQDQLATHDRQLRHWEKEFVLCFLHRLRHQKNIPWKLSLLFLLRSPRLILILVRTIFNKKQPSEPRD